MAKKTEYTKKEIKNLTKQMGSVEERGILNPLHFIRLGYDSMKKTKGSETCYHFHIAHDYPFMKEIYLKYQRRKEQNSLSGRFAENVSCPLECNWVLTPEAIISDFIESVKIAKVKLNPRTRMLNQYGNPRGTETFSANLIVDDPFSYLGECKNPFLFWADMFLERDNAPYFSSKYPSRTLYCNSYLKKGEFPVENLGLVFEAYTTTLKKFINKKNGKKNRLEISVKKNIRGEICQENSLGRAMNAWNDRCWNNY